MPSSRMKELAVGSHQYLIFLTGLKGADTSLAQPSCLDMKLQLRVELRDIKSYSNTASVILRGAERRSRRIH